MENSVEKVQKVGMDGNFHVVENFVEKVQNSGGAGGEPAFYVSNPRPRPQPPFDGIPILTVFSPCAPEKPSFYSTFPLDSGVFHIPGKTGPVPWKLLHICGKMEDAEKRDAPVEGASRC